jgi:deoxycytidine triphosphate deaminase
MILTGPEIQRQHARGKITIDPFDPVRLNPDSYDVRLGEMLRCYTRFPLDSAAENPMMELVIPPEGIVLEPGRLYLGQTIERIGSAWYVPSLGARSSVARLGLFITLSSALGQLGDTRPWPLHLVAVQPLRLYAGMAVGQVSWWKPQGPRTAPPVTESHRSTS